MLERCRFHGKLDHLTSPFLSQTPLILRPLFRSSPLTESLEQALQFLFEFWKFSGICRIKSQLCDFEQLFKVFSLYSEINPAIEIVMASVGSVWIICAWTATLDSSSLATQQWTIVFWLGVLSNFSLHTIGEVFLKATSSDGRICIRFLILFLLWY